MSLRWPLIALLVACTSENPEESDTQVETSDSESEVDVDVGDFRFDEATVTYELLDVVAQGVGGGITEAVGQNAMSVSLDILTDWDMSLQVGHQIVSELGAQDHQLVEVDDGLTLGGGAQVRANMLVELSGRGSIAPQIDITQEITVAAKSFDSPWFRPPGVYQSMSGDPVEVVLNAPMDLQNCPTCVNATLSGRVIITPSWEFGVVKASVTGSDGGEHHAFTSLDDKYSVLDLIDIDAENLVLPMSMDFEFRPTYSCDVLGSVIVETTSAGQPILVGVDSTFEVTGITADEIPLDAVDAWLPRK